MSTQTESTTTEKAETEPKSDALLQVKDLVKMFPVRKRGIITRTVGQVQAVSGRSFDLKAGETLGLVGESGCGKSTVARTLLRLIEPTSGQALYKGTDIFSLGKGDLRELRHRVARKFVVAVASPVLRRGGRLIDDPATARHRAFNMEVARSTR